MGANTTPGKSPQKKVVEELLFLIKALGRLPASWLSDELVGEPCQRQEPASILTV